MGEGAGMMTYYNKLVRDRIPDIIRAQGQTPVVRTLDEAEYLHYLEKKLDEEVQEFHCDRNTEELADILEVVFALAQAQGISNEKLMELYRKKHDRRGGFSDRVFLIGKEG
jgi:predicted house-cleaning noncanonical NTP pyrophosphatase (MazG superfamily)